MTVGGIVVCRMDSRRLPGKVLRQAVRRPLLWYVLARAGAVSALAGKLIVATTDREVDEPIVRFCEEHGYQCYRGAAEDVAGRVLACARHFGLDWLYRLNGDSPFLEPSLLSTAWELASAGDCEFVTNLLPRSFPYGVSVELLQTAALERAYRQMTSAEEREHVTLFLHQHSGKFRYHNILQGGEDSSSVRLTVDTEADFAFFARVVDLLGARWTEASYREVMELRRGLAEVQPDGATFGPDPSVVPSLATNETGRSSP